MTTTKQLGRFLHDNGLRMRVDLSRRSGFIVTLEKPESGASKKRPILRLYEGTGETFPDAVDAALRNFSRHGFVS